MRIMLVDDEREVVDNLKIILESRGFSCEIAYDGQQALDLFGKMTPDLVVTDFNMPHATGFQLAQNIRKSQSTVPIILITAYSGYAERALKFGITHCLVKPFEIEELTGLIEGYAQQVEQSS